MYKKIDGLKFGSWAIDEQEYNELMNYANANDIKSVVEFGCGTSTYLFKQAPVYMGYEMHEESIKPHADKYIIRRDLHLELTDEQIKQDVMNSGIKKFDIAFVDGPPNPSGKYEIRRYSVIAAKKMADKIIMHDTKRPGETAIIDKELKGWKRTEFKSARGLTLFERQKGKRNATRKTY